jgi:hypothetical protein
VAVEFGGRPPAPVIPLGGTDPGVIVYYALDGELLILSPDGSEIARTPVDRAPPWVAAYEGALLEGARGSGSALDIAVSTNFERFVAGTDAGQWVPPLGGEVDRSRFQVLGSDGRYSLLDLREFDIAALPDGLGGARPVLSPGGDWLAGLSESGDRLWVARPGAPEQATASAMVETGWELRHFGFTSDTEVRAAVHADDGRVFLLQVDMTSGDVRQIQLPVDQVLHLGSPTVVVGGLEGSGEVAVIDPRTGKILYSHQASLRSAPRPLGEGVLFLDARGWWFVDRTGTGTLLPVDAARLRAADLHGDAAWFHDPEGSVDAAELVVFDATDGSLTDLGEIVGPLDQVFSVELFSHSSTGVATAGLRTRSGRIDLVVIEGSAVAVAHTYDGRGSLPSPDGRYLLYAEGLDDSELVRLMRLDRSTGDHVRLAELPRGDALLWVSAPTQAVGSLF